MVSRRPYEKACDDVLNGISTQGTGHLHRSGTGLLNLGVLRSQNPGKKLECIVERVPGKRKKAEGVSSGPCVVRDNWD